MIKGQKWGRKSASESPFVPSISTDSVCVRAHRSLLKIPTIMDLASARPVDHDVNFMIDAEETAVDAEETAVDAEGDRRRRGRGRPLSARECGPPYSLIYP